MKSFFYIPRRWAFWRSEPEIKHRFAAEVFVPTAAKGEIYPHEWERKNV